MPRLAPSALLLAAVLALAGCESDEERAERYYQSALSLLAEGDIDRALIELRNVFDNDGFHREARKLYADTILARGQVSEAYGQYLRLIEQYPDTLDVRLILADLALRTGNWDELERHGQAAVALAPDDPAVKAVAAALAYRDAAVDGDDAAKTGAAEEARAVLETLPDNRIARSILIDALLTGDDPAAALPQIDAALEREPDSLDLHVLKFRLLVELGREDEAEALLEQMAERFPENEEVRRNLIAWYLARGNLDGAEQILRDLAGPPDGETGGHVTLVQFLEQARGPEAAAAELERLVEAAGDSPNADLFRALRATLRFQSGETGPAIAAMQEIVDGAEASDQTRRIKLMLARMLVTTGNPVGARALVEEVLEEDPTNVGALKMRAAWAIQDDDPGAAIDDLRAALNQAPRDPEVMTLMAEAHERDGATELAGERLAAAVEVSGNAPAETLRYAQYMMAQGRDIAARAALADARRVSPGNLELLSASGRLALQQEDWATVEEIVASLEALETAEATQMATDLRMARMMGEGQIGEVVSRLESQIAEGGDTALRATALLALTRFRDGDAEGARGALDSALETAPENPDLLILSANLNLAMDEPEAAEADFRAAIAADPGNEQAVARLHGLLTSLDRGPEAAEVLEAGLAAAPDSVLLRMMKAADLEAGTDIAGAIAIYEELYAEDSSNLIVANNLASLIGTHIEDPAALDRAAAIARRLRDRPVPAFQDTYGWIEYRRGNYEDALASLEPAAAGLPEDPLVQFHLGMTYVALDRTEEGRATLTRALDLAGDSPLPQFETARRTLADLPEDGGGEEAN